MKPWCNSSCLLCCGVCTARSSYRSGETPVTAASLDSGLSGSVYSLLDEEAEANEVDSAIFQVPRLWENIPLQFGIYMEVYMLNIYCVLFLNIFFF